MRASFCLSLFAFISADDASDVLAPHKISRGTLRSSSTAPSLPSRDLCGGLGAAALTFGSHLSTLRPLGCGESSPGAFMSLTRSTRLPTIISQIVSRLIRPKPCASSLNPGAFAIITAAPTPIRTGSGKRSNSPCSYARNASRMSARLGRGSHRRLGFYESSRSTPPLTTEGHC